MQRSTSLMSARGLGDGQLHGRAKRGSSCFQQEPTGQASKLWLSCAGNFIEDDDGAGYGDIGEEDEWGSREEEAEAAPALGDKEAVSKKRTGGRDAAAGEAAAAGLGCPKGVHGGPAMLQQIRVQQSACSCQQGGGRYSSIAGDQPVAVGGCRQGTQQVAVMLQRAGLCRHRRQSTEGTKLRAAMAKRAAQCNSNGVERLHDAVPAGCAVQVAIHYTPSRMATDSMHLQVIPHPAGCRHIVGRVAIAADRVCLRRQSGVLQPSSA